jgi:hypothetical protein
MPAVPRPEQIGGQAAPRAQRDVARHAGVGRRSSRAGRTEDWRWNSLVESLPNNYVFRDDKPRTVSVHTDAIMEALTKIYDATRIANELLGKK